MIAKNMTLEQVQQAIAKLVEKRWKDLPPEERDKAELFLEEVEQFLDEVGRLLDGVEEELEKRV